MSGISVEVAATASILAWIVVLGEVLALVPFESAQTLGGLLVLLGG